MMLATEQQENGPNVLGAWHNSIECTRHDALCDGRQDWCFEHGQLWITCLCGAAWSACDSEGGEMSYDEDGNGWTFEQVSEGEPTKD